MLDIYSTYTQHILKIRRPLVGQDVLDLLGDRVYPIPLTPFPLTPHPAICEKNTAKHACFEENIDIHARRGGHHAKYSVYLCVWVITLRTYESLDDDPSE